MQKGSCARQWQARAVRWGISGRREAAGAVSLRRRVLASILAVAACAVLVLTLPLAWATHRIYRSSAVATLERDAIWVGATLPWESRRTEGLRLPDDPSPGADVALYTPAGRRISGDGPASSPVAGRAGDGKLHDGVEGGQLAVAAPLSRRGTVVAVVRVWLPWDVVADRTEGTWLALAALGAAIVAVSAVPARHLARRIATPLERLTAHAQALGEGDFSVRPARSGIREADAAGQALTATAHRLGDLLERERRFSTAVSHQLRTPLTALMLGLESAQCVDGTGEHRQALATALRRAEQLNSTIEELLQLSRDTHRRSETISVAVLLDQLARRHRDTLTEEGRSLTVECEPDLPEVRASQAAVKQIMDVLVDNAATHGRGRIRLLARDVGTGVALEVMDEGPGPGACGEAVFAVPRRGGHGIGLGLARSLAQAEGGRLVLRHPGPNPVFSLLLPVTENALLAGTSP
ncbi:HAMP domain-containing histidine kinase [Streptomyces sp. ET3-23]|uniref:sensor histidine kinase n=1 Tax=Streptomyces sp. ET3-23 TaxID=2885643 RepID=UPI001D11EC4C|nr:HAMP domain-containing sensor histidine kinase [Streptomyces sp. ET3-23]MCC2275240.1 HAMP domain-containing histidine kinase [Streptomyces sp. ET3-23]